MKRISIILSFIAILALTTTSCVKDLDTKPIDPNVFVASNILSRPGAAKEALAKLYASFAVPGQDGVSGSGDISGIDNGFGVYTRALWMLQELTTDEALCAWNDQTIKDFHWQTWSPTDVFNAAMYSRIIYTVSICNEFIRITNGSADPEIMKYAAEARFLRALAYYHAIDMYGNPAFITEADLPGIFFPKRITRKQLFAYVSSELKDIADNNKLGEPRFEYGRADKAAAWMLLSRLYLNANVYLANAEDPSQVLPDGDATYKAYLDSCLIYCGKVKSAGYILEPDYRANFCADNNLSQEMIFAINYDGRYTRSYGGTGYIIHAATGGFMDAAALGIGSGWGGNRTTREFVNVLTNGYHPTMADSMFTQVPDKRVYLELLGSWDINNVGTFTDGIGVRKYTNMNHDGTAAIHYHNDFPCTDFPIFRLADAYLMEAEACLRLNQNTGLAVDDVNAIRHRAFGDDNHTVTIGQLQLNNFQYILDERGRELYWESVRRTDLIRFQEFTTSTYVWQWKGNAINGTSSKSYRNLFPIPASEVAANPNIKQNPGY